MPWIAACQVFCFTGLLAAESALEYNRDIRPILADHCFKCHGPDSASRKADLRLDQPDAAMDALAFVPGKPDESEAIRRVFSEDREEVMPPPEQPQQLTAQQKEILRQWVQEGAAYQKHWSFLTPVRPALPPVRDMSWPREPLDRFVLARLEAAGLRPAPEADRRTLARRLSLDLRGLPPAADEVEAFVQDTEPDAYEKLVDRWLESRSWGEHRARYWLDVARYADTHGIHFDNFREMWIFRDWVIDAFNRNLPFDQFTIEQLAGDLLPHPTLEQLTASGFNRCHITTNEGGIIDEEYLVLYTRDRTETVAQVWLGLTMNCVTCHDHKFDPIAQREFYEMAAFFNNTTQPARDGNIKDSPPIVPVPAAADRERWQSVERELAAARQRLDERRAAVRPDFDRWLASPRAADDFANRLPVGGLHLHAPLGEGSGATTRLHLADQVRELPLPQQASWQPGPTGSSVQFTGGICELPEAGDFDKQQAFSCAAWIKLPANDSHGAIAARMDNASSYRGWDFWVEQRRVGMHVIHHWSDDALKVISKEQVPANEWVHVAVSYDGSAKAAGIQVYVNGRQQETQVQADTLQSSIRTAVPFRIGQRNSSEPIAGLTLQDLRVYERALSGQEIESLAQSSRYAAVLAKPAEQRTEPERNALFGWWVATLEPGAVALSREVARLEREQSDLKGRATIAYVMQERNEAAMAYVLFRGEYDKRRDAVKPDTPDILPPMPADLPRNRLGFARWLVRADQPLTARVTVNRFWQELFGAGLVLTAGDFGAAGQLPSHPELLDWLAVDFRESGWDIKRFYKTLVMSATYRQSALVTADKLEKDPQNRLLSRGARFRMDAEMVRDYALAVSGLLSGKIGGPSVKPYQPDGVWESIAMNVSNTRSYQRESGENLYRRSLYTFWKRMAPPAAMEIFNAPTREYCVVRRERTNTPLQALAALNDVQFVEAARRVAELTLLAASEQEARLDWLARRILSRPFRPEELVLVQQSLSELRTYYAANPGDARRLVEVGESPRDGRLEPPMLAAWTMLCNELLNLDEVLCK